MAGINIATLKTRLVMDAKQFNRAAKKANQDLKGIESASKRAGGGLKNLARHARAFVGIGLAAGALAVGKAIIGAAAAMETARVGFTTLLKSGEKAKAFLEDLVQFAKKTPFELRGLQRNAKQLLAFGFQARDVIPILTDVGNAVGALGGGTAVIDSVTRALGQMRGKGRVMTQEMNQLTEQGIAAWEFLAKAIGTDTAGAMKLVEQGAIDAATGIAAIRQGMRDFFAGGMEAQSKTLAGIWSNFQDTLFQTASDVGMELLPALKKLVPVLGDLVNVIARRAIKALRDFAKAAEPLLLYFELGAELAETLGIKSAVAGDKMAELGQQAQETIDPVAGAAAKWQILKDALIDVGLVSTDVEKEQARVREAFEAGRIEMDESVGTLVRLSRRFVDARDSGGLFADETARLVEISRRYKRDLPPLSEDLSTLRARLDAARTAVVNLANEQRAAADPIFNLFKRTQEYNEAARAYTELQLSGAASSAELDQAVTDQMEAWLLLTAAQQGANSLSAESVTAFEGIARSAGIADEVVRAFLLDLGLIPSVVETEIRVRQTGPKPGFTGKPRHAQHGGTFHAGELAMVGERGPELVAFGKAAQVMSNMDTRSLMSAPPAPATFGGASTTIVVNVAGSVIGEEDLAMKIRDHLVRLGRNNPTSGIS